MGYEADERGGDVYLRGFGQVEVPFNSEPIELPDTEPTEQIELPNTEERPETELPEKEFEALSKAYEKKYKVLKSDADKERRGKIWKVFDARARSIEEPFYKAMQTAFTKQNEEVNKTIRKACEENKDVGTAIENLYNKEMDKKLLHTMAGAFFNGLTVGAEHGLELLNKKGVKEISEETRRLFNIWIDTYGLNLAKDIDDTTKKKLRKALSESIEEGEDLKKRVAKLIEVSDEMFAEDKKWRAELIARTESCTTMNAGAIELYKSEDIGYKEWISVQDDRTRDSHLLMDGVVVPITDKFEVPATSQSEGAFMEYAGDPSAPAGQVCNCRCTVAPFVMM
jgi:SPP1 gp7 family putative phage head morphogenesis protein